MSTQKKPTAEDTKKKVKPSMLGWGLAKNAASAIANRKKRTDLAIAEAGG